MNAPVWLENSVIEGLQRLLILRLRNAPANDTVDALLNVWLEVMMSAQAWDERRDVPRLRTAFMSVASTTDTWPSPAQIIKAMPKPEPQPYLPPPPPTTDPVHVAKCQAKIAEFQRQIFKKVR